MPQTGKDGKKVIDIEHWALKEGNGACISFKPPGNLKVGNVICYGSCTATIDGLPYPSGTLFHITQDAGSYAEFAVEAGKTQVSPCTGTPRRINQWHKEAD
ncbi:hypothetical protein N8T08_000459 [Aspergillus melleus]|uniref:Uncharacterized protein n=1 Tax=Aspergillus melleus TaxID=138277 RepID=A0ACC3BB91_9EURO|nr:hypothetical protein N8T08_000459 [Aspergillus melleus]